MKFAPGAWRYAALPLLAAPFALIFSALASAVAVVTGVAVLGFFRDPDRSPPPRGVVSPADGRISVLREEGDRVRVGVFMNVWNVHVARAPFAGTVADVDHSPGAHKPAFSKDSDRNEKVRVRFAADDAAGEDNAVDGDGRETAADRDGIDDPAADGEVTLIAGAFARRIHPYVDAGDAVDRGERIGHIAFGSRVDVLLPPEVDPADVVVAPGDRVTAGETVICEWTETHSAFDLEVELDDDSEASGRADEFDAASDGGRNEGEDDGERGGDGWN